MAQRGRPPAAFGPKVRMDLYLDPILAAEIKLLLTDPVRQKPKYGALNSVMEKLLRDWVDEQRKQHKQQSTNSQENKP